MKPDYWFTLIAQIVNFLVLVWLLKRFLFARIVQAMNDREAMIVRRLEDAARIRAEAEREMERYQTGNRELQERRDQMLAQARQETETYRQKRIEAAHLEAEEAQNQWVLSLQREQRALLQELRERIGQQVFTIARGALKELANAELEQQMLKVFVERLRTLGAVEREAIASAVRDSDPEVEIRSAFPLLPEDRESMVRSLREQLHDRMDVRFTTVRELICGIELRAHSHRLVWNLDSYLAGLEDRVFEVLDEGGNRNARLQ